MADLSSLTSQADNLATKLGFWNSWIVIALCVTALAAVAIVLGQRMANSRAQQLSNVQSQIAAIKESALQARADQLQQGLADSERETARLNKIAEHERLARVAIEERLAWRRITPKQRDKFITALKQYAGSFAKVDGMGNGELESETFAKDIAAVLQEAGWNVPAPDFSNVTIPAPLGLQCRVDKRSEAGKALAELLNTLPTATVEDKPLSGGAIAFIRVGLRPPP